jgi:hypothetical protein
MATATRGSLKICRTCLVSDIDREEQLQLLVVAVLPGSVPGSVRADCGQRHDVGPFERFLDSSFQILVTTATSVPGLRRPARRPPCRRHLYGRKSHGGCRSLRTSPERSLPDLPGQPHITGQVPHVNVGGGCGQQGHHSGADALIVKMHRDFHHIFATVIAGRRAP